MENPDRFSKGGVVGMMKDDYKAVAPFLIVKKAVASFFVVTWPPNQIIIAILKRNHCTESDEKLASDILDKNSRAYFKRLNNANLIKLT